jgi:cytochrome c-type biogenesis protein
MASVTLIVAFIAGIVSFLSPCVLPLLPGFLAYLSGTGIGQDRARTFAHSVVYVLGFASVFSVLGILLNTVLLSVASGVQMWLSWIGGTIIIVFGLHLTGLIRIPFLSQDHTADVKTRSATYLTSFLFGASFAVGWSPCVGPVLGSVLALAAAQPGIAFPLLLSYSLGLGLPFLAVGLFSTQALALIRKYGKLLRYFNIIVGVLLIALGILVFTQTLNLVANLGFVNNLLLR